MNRLDFGVRISECGIKDMEREAKGGELSLALRASLACGVISPSGVICGYFSGARSVNDGRRPNDSEANDARRANIASVSEQTSSITK